MKQYIRLIAASLLIATAMNTPAFGTEKDLAIDLSDAAVDGTLVIDLSMFGDCKGMSIFMKDAAGKPIAATLGLE